MAGAWVGVDGWALMGNHHHLSIETPDANLVTWMQWLHNAVTRKVVENHLGKLEPERRLLVRRLRKFTQMQCIPSFQNGTKDTKPIAPAGVVFLPALCGQFIG